MSERHEVMAEVRRWVRKAEHDLRNAEYVSTMEEDCPFAPPERGTILPGGLHVPMAEHIKPGVDERGPTAPRRMI